MKQDEKLALEQENPLTTDQSRLRVLAAGYEEFLDRLQSKRAALVEAQAQLESAEEALAAEPEFLTLERVVSNDVFWTFLASNPDGDAVEALLDLTVEEQVRNDIYSSLKVQTISLRSRVNTFDDEIAYLEARTVEFQQPIQELSNHISTIQLQLSRINREIGVLSSNLDRLAQARLEAQIAKEEQAGFIRVVETAVEPSVPVGVLPQQDVITIAVILGLVLGVEMAYFIHYVQRPQASRQRSGSPQPDEPAS